MDMYNQSKKIDSIVADAICNIAELCDYDLTTEEKISLLCMIEQLQNVACRFRKDMRLEYESIL